MSFQCTLILGILAYGVTALAPPQANFTEEFVSLASPYRRRLSYEPRHISPLHCLFISREECQRDDESVGAKIVQRKTLSIGKNLKVLVLLCRFSDHGDRELPSRDYYEELFNGSGPSDVNPVGSIREYLYSNSLGRYEGMTFLLKTLNLNNFPVTFDVQPWKTTENTEAYYAGGDFGLRGAEAMQEMFKPLLTDLYNTGYNFLPFDSDRW